MLKTSKILWFGIGGATVATGSWLAWQTWGRQPEVKPLKNEKVKVFDTIPDRDSALDKLNKILADNKNASGAKTNSREVVVENYENIDKNSQLYDSLVQAGLVVDVNNETTIEKRIFENNTVIKADKFISRKELKVLGIKEGSSKDSVLNNLAEIRYYKRNRISVEFWESPVNYKGYRLGGDKMVLFGIMPEGVNLVYHNAILYLTTLNNVYMVKSCSDFCQLKPIKDQTLCSEVMRHVN